jgi:GT2 family glycosyltransferase
MLSVSVLIPTIGRPNLLARCLDSIVACAPSAAEIVVADQSEGHATERLVLRYVGLGGRHVPVQGRGMSLALNVGLRACAYDIVLVTNDDCTVDLAWVGEGSRLMAADPEAIVTGRVLPGAGGRHVPSTIDYPHPHDFSGGVAVTGIFPGNMVLNRHAVLGLGGFDERLTAAEDNDLCYRWLKAGNHLRYEPSLVVWHHDWRSPAQLRQLYRRYSREQGRFYAKHLRAGDTGVLRFLVNDLYRGVRGQLGAIVKRRPSWADARPRVCRTLLPGLVGGWRKFGGRGR